MTRAYGGCIEPEGWDLAEDYGAEPCPRCQAPARTWFIERADGSLNMYAGLSCQACGFEAGDCPDDG